MTKAQRANVLMLRHKGFSYREISRETGVPVNTVKSLCHRSGVKTPNAYEETGNEENKETKPFCQHCGVRVEQSPYTRKKRFCSDTCRHRWWNANRNRVNGKTEIRLACSHCGLLFSSYAYQQRKYCSHSCYLKGRYGGGAA